MESIAKIDPNFNVSEAFGREDVLLRSCREEPFSVHGLLDDGTHFFRVPHEVTSTVSEGVGYLAKHTAGGRVRFRTDSPFVAIRVISKGLGRMAHFAFAGSGGVDMYADGVYVKTFIPPLDKSNYSGIFDFGKRRMREILLELPLYSLLTDLEIGLAPDAVTEAPTPYRNPVPAVFYGSSITQGGCASRPGSCYQAILSRRFDLDYVNLGFSGNAKGEPTMADYIAGLTMSMFFLDYDYNAPSLEHLAATHEPFFLRVREAHPTTPIIIMSRPKAIRSAEEEARLSVIRRTYENALARGDKNVYFVDGDALTAVCGNEGTVDNCHPTDLGFFSMAQALIGLIEREGLLK